MIARHPAFIGALPRIIAWPHRGDSSRAKRVLRQQLGYEIKFESNGAVKGPTIGIRNGISLKLQLLWFFRCSRLGDCLGFAGAQIYLMVVAQQAATQIQAFDSGGLTVP